MFASLLEGSFLYKYPGIFTSHSLSSRSLINTFLLQRFDFDIISNLLSKINTSSDIQYQQYHYKHEFLSKIILFPDQNLQINVSLFQLMLES